LQTRIHAEVAISPGRNAVFLAFAGTQGIRTGRESLREGVPERFVEVFVVGRELNLVESGLVIDVSEQSRLNNVSNDIS
jgi:hypothetical protein